VTSGPSGYPKKPERAIRPITENVTLSRAWMQGFRNAIEGSVLQERGASTRPDAQVDTLWAP
jgi:hypothetical protein